jgi:hypothetical protein
MDRIYVFLIRNDVWIYILCALGLFWYASEYVRSRRLLRRAMFGLERETGASVRNNALLFILLLSAIISTVYYVNAEIAPELPAELLRPPTPTPDVFTTPLASPTPLSAPDASPTSPPAPTITLPSQAGIPIPESNSPPNETDNGADTSSGDSPPLNSNEPPPTPAVGCTPDLNIRDPRAGGVISGVISLSGTAGGNNFAAYKVEANGPQTSGQWALLLEQEAPVQDGSLGNVNLSQWASGPYLIRLTAIDSSSNETGYCVVQVTLDN